MEPREILAMARKHGRISIQLHERVSIENFEWSGILGAVHTSSRTVRDVPTGGDYETAVQLVHEGRLTMSEPRELMHLEAEPLCFEARRRGITGRVYVVDFRPVRLAASQTSRPSSLPPAGIR